ncbi:MAG: VCBS repeat-containing protein [Candidatus Poseidoniales archaeon]
MSLVVLFLLSLLSPLLMNPVDAPTLDEPTEVGFSGPFTLASGYGHDLAGSTLDVDGLVGATVREESMLDLWETEGLNVSFGEHHGTPDMKLTRHDKAHLCWSTQEGTVRTAVHRPTGTWTTSLVDTVATANASDLVDCAIGITANELPRVLYADGDDLKMGRYAKQSATYYDGPRWHTRTIMEDVSPTHLALDITPQGLEWGLMRTATGALHQVNFSGAYWTDYLLDEGPVGEKFELQVDEDGVAHVLYTLTATGEVVLLRIDGMEHDRRLLLQDDDLADVLGMDLDANNIEQVATATQSGSTFSVNLIRSLAGQDTGRVNPVPSTALEGEDDEDEGLMLMGDLNADGVDDLVISTPTADVVSMTDNGRVSVHYGSTTGLSDLPDMIYAGASDGAHYGAGMALGDFNNDGIMDLAVGSPGWAPADDAELRHGLVHVYLGNASGLSPTPWVNLTGASNESLGSAVEALHHTGSGASLAATARNYTSVVSETRTDAGKVNLYTSNESGLFTSRNLTQTKDGGLFGRSIEACDVNNDGHDELIVGNTGDFSKPATYSSIEYFFGSSSGYNGTADHALESIVQGKLFGFNIACVGDLNGDGFDEHIISEPFNSTTGAFGAGTLWLFEGTNGQLPSEADWRYWPPANSRIGESMVAAGDINEDGYGDVYISSRMGNAAGRVEIFLGSPTGISDDRQLLAEGNSSEHLGFRMAAGGDINGDGLSDLFYSMRSQDRGDDFGLTYLMVSEQDWESISFERQGTVTDVQLGTAGRGETSIVYTHADALRLHVSKLEHMNDGTPGGQWVDQTLVSLNTSHLGVAFDVRSSGQPVVVMENTSAMMLASTTSMTALQQTVATTGTMGQWLGSTITHDNKQVLAYTSGVGNQIFASSQSSTGWSSELVRTGADLSQAIDVNVDSLNTPHLVYRLSSTNQLEMAVGGSSWSLTALGAAGEALSQQHPAMVLDNDSLAVGLVASNGSGTNLEVWIHDGTSLSKHTVANHSELTSELGLAVLDNGSLLVASLTNDGTLRVFEQWPSAGGWVEHTVAQPSGTANEYRLDLKGGASPLLAVRANAISSILGLNETGAWVSLAERPAAAVNGAWDVHHGGDHLLLMTSDPVSNHLIFNSVELNSTSGETNPWMSVRFGDIITNHRVHAEVDANGTVHMAYWDEVNDDVIMLRLYGDEDRDLVFDLIDGLPTVSDQWMDSDGDAYGDNPLGPTPDACPTDAGTSAFIFQGCDDYDTDGYRDDIDGCDQDGGTSWIDRFGCEDLDQDGWSDNDASYFDGDVFKSNWKQALDTDGDGFGDNHGVDCCAVPIDPNAGPGDLFPYLASQYTDYDGDGYGDNDTDTVYGDYCPWDYGTSYRDRNGCLDTDGDGSSDPSGEGTIFEWNATVHGADVWPLDPTQWKDTDGDGYGDNQSANATNPDRFPMRIAAANDTDDDGYADNWTEYYNGSNAQGIFIDACPTEWGNSTRRNLTVYAYGCPDADGDGYTDAYVFDVDPDTGLRINELGDAFPDEKTQSKDKDGDGFGDNPIGVNGDQCIEVPGVLNGTDGVGCRVIDINDDDGDGLINELDLICPNTPLGEQVNEEGCSQSELDDDEDGVKNNLDACPDTAAGATVDAQGCSDEQRNSDSDGDGLNDPEDACPNTAAGMEVDANGCSQAQRDSDGDGLSDLDDACDDTPPGFPILANGCTDESALDTDLDGDGYSGVYTYDVDPITGLHVNQTGDAFPSDATQWFDQDGDGYGDNPSPANNADDCPTETGTSYIDFLGCYDDGDGYRDENEPEALRGDPTQWRDSDFDGYGDNWGDPAWNATRDPSWPGQFVAGATNADFCPKTTPGLQVDDEGCHISERDSDLDGVMDDQDNCPNEPKGVDGYDDGCPYIPLSGDGEEGLFGVDAGTIMLALGGLGGLLILSLLVVRLLRSEDDDDDDEYDDFYDDEEEESILDTMDRAAAAPVRSRPAPQRASSPAAKKGPGGPAPSRQAPTRQAGPPGRAPGGPPRGGGGPPGRGPSKKPSPSQAKAPQKAGKKKVVSQEEEPGKKVRKAKINVDMSIFEDWQADDREAAVDWVVGAFADGDQERTVLMQLQETGWTAEQSRAICNLAKNKRG